MSKVVATFFLCLFGISFAYSQAKNTREIKSETINNFKKQGIISYQKRDFLKADTAFRKCIEYAKAAESWESLGQCHNNLGGVQFQLNKYAEGIVNYENATEIYKEHGLDTLLGQSYINLGLAYKRQSIYDSAISNFYTGIEILETLQVKGSLIRGYNMLANTLRETNSYEQSKKWYLESLRLAENQNDQLAIASAYNNLGTLYRKLDKLDSAIAYYRSSLVLKKETRQFKRIGNTHFNLGESFLDIESYDSARGHLYKSLKYRALVKDDFGMAHSHLSLSKLFLVQGETGKVKTHLDSASVLVFSLSSIDLRIKFLEVKRNYLLSTKKHQNAKSIDYQVQKLRDEILNQEKQSLITSYEVKYGVQKLKQTIISKNETLFWAFISMGFLVIIGVFLFRERQRKKKAAEVVETLFKDMHHRVKNSLSLLNGIVTFKRRSIRDIDTKALLKAIGGQLDTMNLIHQKLYLEKGKEVGNTDLSEYLQELVENVFVSSGIDSENYNLNFELDSVFVSADKANPIGLIVNEAATNAIKYGKSKNGGWYFSVIVEDIGAQVKITLRDTGEGFSSETEVTNKSGIGLMEILSKQIGAALNIVNSNGVELTLVYEK